MVEIIGASKIAPYTYACEAIIRVEEEFMKVRFGIDELAYMLLKRLLAFQPFEKGGFGKYRYYFTGGYRKEDQYAKGAMSIRVEQNSRYKTFGLESAQALTANLLWIQRFEAKAEAVPFCF